MREEIEEDTFRRDDSQIWLLRRTKPEPEPEEYVGIVQSSHLILIWMNYVANNGYR